MYQLQFICNSGHDVTVVYDQWCYGALFYEGTRVCISFAFVSCASTQTTQRISIDGVTLLC